MLGKKQIILVMLSLLVILLLTACSRPNYSSEPGALKKSDSVYNAEVSISKKSDVGNNKDSTTQELDFFLIDKFDKSKNRLLEYTVNASYECNDLNNARKTLLDIVNSYGFIKNASSSISNESSYINANIYVEIGLLYQSLNDLKKIGKLISEEIVVEDLTESMMIAQKKQNREKIRITRRTKAAETASPKDTEWITKETALEQSEDKLDNAEIEQWKINDRVQWVKINLHIQGPEKPYSVKVPLFKNAFIGLINLSLNIVYVLIYILPFAILIFLIYKILKNKKSIKTFFDKLKNK